MTAGTFENAASLFVKSADWLGDEHQPAIVGLLECAKALDRQFQAATYAQYGVTHRYLMKQRPSDVDADDDPLLTEL